MKNMKLSAALLALASFAVIGTAAPAATTTYNNGDVLLGVYDTSGSVTTNYEVDLGSLASLTSATLPINYVLTTDLSTIFGTSYPSSLAYAIVDTSLSTTPYSTYPGGTDFITQAETTPGTYNTPFTLAVGSGNSTLSSKIHNLTKGAVSSGGFSGESTTGTSFANATKIPKGDADSFQSISGGTASNFGQGSNLAAFNTLGTGVSQFDELNTDGTSKILGSFTLSDLGVLTFDPYTASVVPEPSTYALFACGGLLLAWVLKRRSAKV